MVIFNSYVKLPEGSHLVQWNVFQSCIAEAIPWFEF